MHLLRCWLRFELRFDLRALALHRRIAVPCLALPLMGALLLLAGCGESTPELSVPAQEIRLWPSEQFAQIQAQPDERFFVLDSLPPRLFFRPGDDCGALTCLQIQVAGWPSIGAPATAGNLLAQPPQVQFYLTDRHARADARFTPAQGIDWEGRGGREAIELRATPAGVSPTPVTAVPFAAGWVYRVTVLAQFADRSVQRTVWLGPEGFRDRALATE